MLATDALAQDVAFWAPIATMRPRPVATPTRNVLTLPTVGPPAGGPQLRIAYLASMSTGAAERFLIVRW